LSVVDLERFAELGRRHNVETLIDATLATPYNARPLEYGVDYVLHSATKYLGGHNDLLAGVIIGSREKLEPVRKLRGIMGAINSPTTSTCWNAASRRSSCACSGTTKTASASPSS
jgi:cystathionine gamma-synthase